MNKKQITSAQKVMLLQCMEEQPQLVKHRVSNQYTNIHIRNNWVEIATKLNSIPGASKTWQEWRKCWSDMKSRSKKKRAQLKRSSNQTGGGPPEKDDLNTIDEKVLDIIGGDIVISGVPVEETGLPIKVGGEIIEINNIQDLDILDNSKNKQFTEKMDESEEENEVKEGGEKGDILIKPNTSKKVTRPPLRSKNARGKNTPLQKKNQLSASIESSKELLSISKQQLELKKEHYSQKRELLQKQNIMLENLTVTVKNIENVLTRLVPPNMP